MTTMTINEAPEVLRGLAKVIRKYGTCPPMALEDVATTIDAHLAKGAQEWQPIETAPRNGLPRLYLCNGRIVQGFVDATGLLTVQDECGWRAIRRNPTHWMPLPAAPMLSQRGEEES